MLIPTLQERLRQAVLAVLPGADPSRVLLRPCANPAHGDYETTALMALAREARQNPRQLAADVRDRLDVGDLCEAAEISGPGFLNLRLRPGAIGEVLAAAARGEVPLHFPAAQPRTIVIDFSSPN